MRIFMLILACLLAGSMSEAEAQQRAVAAPRSGQPCLAPVPQGNLLQRRDETIGREYVDSYGQRAVDVTVCVVSGYANAIRALRLDYVIVYETGDGQPACGTANCSYPLEIGNVAPLIGRTGRMPAHAIQLQATVVVPVTTPLDPSRPVTARLSHVRVDFCNAPDLASC